MSNPYLDQLELSIRDLQDVLEDGKVSIGEILQLGNALIPRIRSIMAEAKTFDEQDRQYILDAADALYDKYVVPADIPWIPEPFETNTVDPILKSLIRLALTRAMARFAREGVVGSQVQS